MRTFYSRPHFPFFILPGSVDIGDMSSRKVRVGFLSSITAFCQMYLAHSIDTMKVKVNFMYTPKTTLKAIYNNSENFNIASGLNLIVSSSLESAPKEPVVSKHLAT